MDLLPNMRTLETVGRELKAVAAAVLALPFRPLLASDAYDPEAPRPIPVVLVHGLCGDPTNFFALKRALRSAGIRNFATFAYRPQFAYQRLVARLTETIENVCRETGATQVDLVAHSLGGLIARGVAQSPAGARVRRLATLGSPYLSAELALQEIAIFGASDPLIPTPDADGPRTSVVRSRSERRNRHAAPAAIVSLAAAAAAVDHALLGSRSAQAVLAAGAAHRVGAIAGVDAARRQCGRPSRTS